MRRLTESDLANIAGSIIKDYLVEAVRVKDWPFPDSDRYGFILGKNTLGHYVTWQFHLLEDDSVSVYWGHYHMEDREAAILDFNARGRRPGSQKFSVTITETLKRVVVVEADGQHETEQIVSDRWHNSEYVLEADDFTDVSFKAVPMLDEHSRSLLEGS